MMIIVVSEWSGGVRLAETEVRRIRRLTVCLISLLASACFAS
jgi:hypothetical protein